MEDFYGPLTAEDWLDSLNASYEDLAYGKEREDNQIQGFAGVRHENAWEALKEAGVYPQWNEDTGKWEL